MQFEIRDLQYVLPSAFLGVPGFDRCSFSFEQAEGAYHLANPVGMNVRVNTFARVKDAVRTAFRMPTFASAVA